MPHLVLSGELKLEDLASQIDSEVHRWGSAVLKTEMTWCRSDGGALLVEGVVVEHSRPLHPVAVISIGRGDTSVRLWRLAPVERTPAVQRWLATIASELRRLGGVTLKTTNIADDVWEDLDLN
jgi:hypothetical protein